MHRTRIKICGIKSPSHAKAAAEAGADMIGLVFVETSPRHVTIEQAMAIVASLPPGVEAVGLFVDRPADEIHRIARAVGLHTVQLHGHEPVSILGELGQMRVIRAHPFDLRFVEALKPWDQHPSVTALLFDTPPHDEYALMGGSGKSFRWSELKAMGILPFDKPYMLAGGLTPNNVADAVRDLRPYAVDVSSGVESSRGVKDVGLIEAFCRAVHAADDTIPAL